MIALAGILVHDGRPRNREARATRRRPLSRPVARGIALFLGLFSLTNLIRYALDGFDANIWWIDMRMIPSPVADLFLLCFGLLMTASALRPPGSGLRRYATMILTAAAAIVAIRDAATFYVLLAGGTLTTDVPFPFSLLVVGALAAIMVNLAGPEERRIGRGDSRLAIGATFLLCLSLFPLMQIVCFGWTDYRREADAIVVLGAQAYADGRPSLPLADRVRKGVELYHAGLARTMIFSGGPGDGAVHETEAMRATAIRMGVPPDAILLDRDGLNTRATARNTAGIFRRNGIDRVIAVSNFYHLPRIKMSYQQEGWQVYTVPADDTIFSGTPRQIAREILGLLVYYIT